MTPKIFRFFLGLNSVVAFLIIYLVVDHDLILIRNLPFFNEMLGRREPKRPIPLIFPQYVVETPGCHIPLMDPFHLSMRPYIFMNDSKSNFNCLENEPLMYVDEDILTVNFTRMAGLKKKWKNVECSYVPFHRRNDDFVHFNLPFRSIQVDALIRDEFMMVQCQNDNNLVVYQDFFASIIPKPDVEARCKRIITQEQDKKGRLSVLLLGLDSMSKSHYFRHFVKTDKFIRRHLTFIELFGYNKIGQDIYSNIIPLLTGKSRGDVVINFATDYFDKLPFIWKEFEKNGYRTLFAEDDPYFSVFNNRKNGFIETPTDYYLRPFVLAAEESSLKRKIPNYVCFPNRSESSVILRWMLDFFDEFEENAGFAYVFLKRLSQRETIPFQDQLILETLQHFWVRDRLKNTVIFFFSNRGFYSDDSRMSNVGQMEDKLPFFFILVPSSLVTQHPLLYHNLKVNERRLVTAFDIHETLKEIANGFEKPTRPPLDARKFSLTEPIPPSRTCKNANIPKLYCSCSGRSQVAKDTHEVKKAAKSMIDFINKFLIADMKHLCHELLLDDIVDVELEIGGTGLVKIYRLTIKVKPSRGIFQGIVSENKKTKKLIVDKEIDRLNGYGDQSSCIDSPELKPYCFCVKKTDHNF